jgi:hypothetical protein
MRPNPVSRRSFLLTGAGASALALSPRLLAQQSSSPLRPKVAAVFTAFAHRWHAHVLLENFLEPYLFNGNMTDPGVDIVSFYADQFPADDMARPVAKDYNIPIFATVAEALTLGGKDLAVDAILLIGEHGDYPNDERGIKMYPRKRLFDECAAVVRTAKRPVPMFVDKHLSYRWDEAQAMYDTARELKIPLMAGSSVPLAARQPSLEISGSPKIEQALSIHGGPFEMYDIHGLEVLQAMVEAREGGETGVQSVRLLQGDELWAAADRGEWEPKLADAALAAELGPNLRPVREFVRSPEVSKSQPHGILVKYADGLVGVTLRIGNAGTRFLYAHRLAGGKIEATRFYVGPWNNRNLFKALSHAIQTHFRQQKPPYPIERTVLTTGVTLAAVDSSVAQGKTIDTPYLLIKYQPTDWSAFRERGESWKIITEETPEPRGITKGGHRGAN